MRRPDFRFPCSQAAFAAAVAAGCLLSASALAQAPPDATRITSIAQWLPDSPAGVGRPIDDRRAWQAVADSSRFRSVEPQAERLLSRAIPELTDELFLEFSRTGNRTRYQKVLGERHTRLPALVLAECLEDRGRFLPAIEESIRAVASEKTWVYPAHDRSLNNFYGKVIEIDLSSAATSWNLATADYWLQDKLSEPVRKLIRSELERRTFGPFESYVNTGKPRLWWATGTNNWNAVCLAGVTGSALSVIEDRRRRAFFLAAAEQHVKHFLNGFTPDGYCSEGVGYWNYGFGHYVLLAETILQATGGRVDLFDDALVGQIARFGPRMEILPGVYPAFADCRVNTHPDTRLMAFLSRRFGLGLHEVEQQGLLTAGGPSTGLFTVGLHVFANSASEMSRAGQPSREGTTPSITITTTWARLRWLGAARLRWSIRAPRSTPPERSAANATKAACSTRSVIRCRWWPTSFRSRAARPRQESSRPISPIRPTRSFSTSAPPIPWRA
jgi:hypothetical protein